MESSEYAYCKTCGNVVYRIPGMRHGDGQQDTEDSPVWLLFGSPEEAEREGIDADELPDVACGCND